MWEGWGREGEGGGGRGGSGLEARYLVYTFTENIYTISRRPSYTLVLVQPRVCTLPSPILVSLPHSFSLRIASAPPPPRPFRLPRLLVLARGETAYLLQQQQQHRWSPRPPQQPASGVRSGGGGAAVRPKSAAGVGGRALHSTTRRRPRPAAMSAGRAGGHAGQAGGRGGGEVPRPHTARDRMVGGVGDVPGHPGDGRCGHPSAAGEDGAVRRVSRNSKQIDSLKLKLRHLDGLQAKIDAGLEASAEQRTRLARRPALTAELAVCMKGLERFGSVRTRLDSVLDTKLLRRHYDRAGHMKC